MSEAVFAALNCHDYMIRNMYRAVLVYMIATPS